MNHELGQGTGPLRGVKVVEIAGIGPGPHACMILADLGADVIRVERPGGQPLTGGPSDLLTRGRPSVALDLKDPSAVATVLDLVADADLLFWGSLAAALAVAFVATVPVNHAMIARGRGHAVVHEMHHAHH